MWRLVHPGRVIAIRRWGSATLASQANVAGLVFGPSDEDSEAPAWEFFIEEAGSRSIVIGSASPADTPLVLGEEWERSLWLAHGARVYALPDDVALTRWVELGSSIAEIRILPDRELLVAVGEADITAIRPDLSILWTLTTDLITNTHWRDGSTLLIDQMDGPTLEVDLLSGTIL